MAFLQVPTLAAFAELAASFQPVEADADLPAPASVLPNGTTPQVPCLVIVGFLGLGFLGVLSSILYTPDADKIPWELCSSQTPYQFFLRPLASLSVGVAL